MTTPSWQPDPFHRHEYRWWDSEQWTEHVSDHGVAGIDPLHQLEAPPHPEWAAPTFSPPAPPAPTAAMPATSMPASSMPMMPVAAAAPPVRRNRTPIIAAGVAAVAALGVGAFFVFRGDDKGSTTPATTTLLTATTEVTETTEAAAATTEVEITPVPTEATPTTAGAFTHEAVLAAAMLTAADVPAGWTNYTEGGGVHDPDTVGGVCDGPNSAALALDLGSDAQIDGPTWDITGGGWFGVEGFTFSSGDAAVSFIDAYVAQAATCVETPNVRTVPESEAQVFAENFAPNAVWTYSLQSTVDSTETSDIADDMVFITNDLTVSTTVDGHGYSFKYTELRWIERYGEYVFEYWLDGENSHTGFSGSPPDYAYTPTFEALGADMLVARDAVLRQLAG